MAGLEAVLLLIPTITIIKGDRRPIEAAPVATILAIVSQRLVATAVVEEEHTMAGMRMTGMAITMRGSTTMVALYKIWAMIIRMVSFTVRRWSSCYSSLESS
jgi:hypothetical protein